jgi:signal transduction histidine kinase
MSNITWGDLNEGQQHEMRYLYGNMKGVIQKDVGDSLLALGLIERDGYYSRLTQSGKECIELANRATTPPQEPAPVSAAGERSMLVFHDIEEANSAIDDANDEIADLRAKLAAAEALASTNAALLANAQHELNTRIRELAALEEERNRLRGALKPFAFCPIHPSWSDDTRCVILMNWNKPGLEVSVNEGLKLGDVRKAANALAADGEGA